jgi:hypothetical protein
MNRTLVFASFAAIIAASACSSQPQTRYALTPIHAGGADLPGLDSRTTVESRQPGSIVSVRPSDQFAELGPGLVIAVQNKGSAPASFGPHDIEATINGARVAVLAADEMDARMKGDLRGYLRATQRTDTVDIEQASAEVSREYRFNNYGGCPAGQGRCQIGSADFGSGYRHDRINREAQAQNVAEAAIVLQANQALISQRALQAYTIAPDQIAGGVIVLQPPRSGGKLDLTVTFNGQKHRFSFSATPSA